MTHRTTRAFPFPLFRLAAAVAAVVFPALHAGAAGPTSAEAEIATGQKPERIVDLRATVDHVQGIDVDGDRLWLSWVDRKARTGHLSVFDLRTGKLLRSVEVQSGARYHPGGIAREGESIWVPVAEYRPRSSAVIQRRNRDTLALEAEFEVADHVGCVAANGDSIYGGNWDSRLIYRWDKSGRQLEVRENRTGTSFQDLKWQSGLLVGSGLRGGEGAVDWLDPRTLEVRKRVRTGKTDRGVIFSHEGMAIFGGRIYFVPEDGPSRVLVFPLP